ncbi:MAG: glycosyltransferase family 9 protein [Alphaproteobacteria bacterium]
MKILFVTSTRIGDAVLSTGLLSHLAASYPQARITIACGAAPAPLFETAPGAERVIVLVKKPLSLHWLGLWARTVTTLWDLVVDLRGSGLAWMLPARARRVLRRDNSPRHRVEHLAEILSLPAPAAPILWTSPAQTAEAERLIPAGEPVIGLGPTANWAPKTWPAENFAALAGRLTAPDGILPGARIALFGAAWERETADRVRHALPDGEIIDLVGDPGLATVAACLERCALYIGNDSGLMHMAAACGTPTLGLFGPSPAIHYAPWGPHTAVAQTETSYQDLVGAADFDHRSDSNLMGGLSVAAVEAAANDLWRRLPGRAA